MKLAWLVKNYDGDEWQIVFVDPRGDSYYDVRAIAYVELQPGAPGEQAA